MTSLLTIPLTIYSFLFLFTWPPSYILSLSSRVIIRRWWYIINNSINEDDHFSYLPSVLVLVYFTSSVLKCIYDVVSIHNRITYLISLLDFVDYDITLQYPNSLETIYESFRPLIYFDNLRSNHNGKLTRWPLQLISTYIRCLSQIDSIIENEN